MAAALAACPGCAEKRDSLGERLPEAQGGSAGSSSGAGSESGGTGAASLAGGKAGSGGGAGSVAIPVGGTSGSGGVSPGEVCAIETASAELEPVYLVLAFDVSGSMGKGDFPWHDVTLKWDPVVAATRSFLEAEASTGLQAALTAFPADVEEDERCEMATYLEPDVPMTALPSDDFGAALDAIREQDWRGGTPTLAVVNGVLSYIDGYAVEHPGRYALVLVTDGYPQGCDDDDDDVAEIEAVVRGVADTIPTFVLGIKNPPLTDEDGETAPDTVSDLTSIARAGGTEAAYLIDTGDPTRTSADFQAAVAEIRGAAVSCALPIPVPPGGRTFEKEKVAVSYASGSTTTELVYDPDCTGVNGWHYDDLDAPETVILCDGTCETLQADPLVEVTVAFTCEVVIDVPR
ncbi:MAG TPA: vWA domain-containing protein [Polyangiaceae bacterium]